MVSNDVFVWFFLKEISTNKLFLFKYITSFDAQGHLGRTTGGRKIMGLNDVFFFLKEISINNFF